MAPPDRLTFAHAMERYHWGADNLQKKIDSQKIAAVPGRQLCGASRIPNDCILVSREDCDREWLNEQARKRRAGLAIKTRLSDQTVNVVRELGFTLSEARENLPTDGICAKEIERKYEISWQTLITQCGWEVHPIFRTLVRDGHWGVEVGNVNLSAPAPAGLQ